MMIIRAVGEVDGPRSDVTGKMMKDRRVLSGGKMVVKSCLSLKAHILSAKRDHCLVEHGAKLPTITIT